MATKERINGSMLNGSIFERPIQHDDTPDPSPEPRIKKQKGRSQKNPVKKTVYFPPDVIKRINAIKQKRELNDEPGRRPNDIIIEALRGGGLSSLE